MKAYINGDIVEDKEAKISIFDRGFLYGDGLFETMRSYEGRVFRMDAHLERLYSSMKTLKIRQRISAKELERAVYDLLSVNNLMDASVRLNVTRGISRNRAFSISKNEPSNVIITSRPFVPRPASFYEKGIKINISRYIRSGRTFVSNVKVPNYLQSIIARNEAMPKGFFETIYLNEDGDITDGSVSNIFMVKGDMLATPSIDCGVLPGITRGTVLKLASFAGLPVSEGRFDPSYLKNADEVFITNSLIEIIPVTKVDDKEIAGGGIGCSTKRLHSLYKEQVRKEAGGWI